MTDLAALFAEQRSSQIEWDGTPLYGIYDLPPTTARVTLTFVSTNSPFRQGLRLKARGGSLTVDGVTADEFVLWQDTAPSDVAADVSWKPTGARSLRVWNCWEHNGVMHAWMGNAGMRVSEVGETVRLRCSDGEAAPDFDNLVAEVHLQ